MDANIRRVLEHVQIPEPPRKPKNNGEDRKRRFALAESDAPPPDDEIPRRDVDLPVGHASHDESGVRVDVTA